LATYALAPFTSNPARAMSIGVLIGGIVQALFQWPFIKQTGWKIAFTSLKKTFSNPGTKKVLKLIGPTIIGMAAYQLNDVVSTALANNAGEGITSSLQYSLRLQELILGIFAVSIGTVILPDLSGLAQKKEWEEFNNMLIQAIKIIVLITIPVTFYSLVNGRELIALLYKNKSFTEESVLLTLGEFRFHIAGLFFIAANRIISPAFYAQGNTKLPTLAGIISFVTNIIFALALVKPMSGNGIALALSMASMVNTIFLFIFMKKMESIKIKKVLKDTLIYILKISIYSVIAAIPCYFLRPTFVNLFANRSRIFSEGLPLVCSLVIFATIGIVELFVTKDSITVSIVRKIKHKNVRLN
jgi:putative peptidoglycan lipid II flippase